ncbi:MAG: OPT/YSL family transporter, partial [Phycisphaerales bacterium]
ACTMPFIVGAGDTSNSKGEVLTQPAYVEAASVTFNGSSLTNVSKISVAVGQVGGAAFTGDLTASSAGFVKPDGSVVSGELRVERGTITHADDTQTKVLSTFNRAQLLNSWALWPGVAMLVCASMVSLFAKPKMLISAFSGLFKKGPRKEDCLAHIELPLWVSFVGIPIVGAIGVYMAHEWFEVRWIWGALAIPLIAVLTLIAANATALTSITPTGSLSKITQFTFGFLDRKFPGADGVANPGVNLMTACMTTEVASNAANLLMDIKPGYMLGAKPRQQVIGHMIGIVSGALASTPLFYILFLAGHKDNAFTAADPELADKTVEEILLADPDKFSFTGAVQWKGISDLITGGLSKLPQSAITAMIIAAVAGVVFEIWRTLAKGKFPISPLALGLGIVLPPDSTIWMFMGSLFFWIMHKLYEKRTASMGHKVWIETHEPICAGLIAGAALVGIGDILTKVFILA